MEAVGYDLYCKMLSEAVQEAKGMKRQEDFETSVDLVMDAFIRRPISRMRGRSWMFISGSRALRTGMKRRICWKS